MKVEKMKTAQSVDENYTFKAFIFYRMKCTQRHGSILQKECLVNGTEYARLERALFDFQIGRLKEPSYTLTPSKGRKVVLRLDKISYLMANNPPFLRRP